MARVCIEETLRGLNKYQIIDLFFKTKEHTNAIIASLTAEIKRLNENFQNLERDVSVVKNVNNILSKQMSSIEIQSSIKDREPESIVCRMLQHTGVDITEERIEACHRLRKQSGRTIVNFSSKKDFELAMQKKH